MATWKVEWLFSDLSAGSVIGQFYHSAMTQQYTSIALERPFDQ